MQKRNIFLKTFLQPLFLLTYIDNVQYNNILSRLKKRAVSTMSLYIKSNRKRLFL